MIRLEFRGEGDFEACYAAEAWCRKLGISVGGMQRDAPRGLWWGEADISKWRDLNSEDRKALDGWMEFPSGSPRRGPVVVEIADPRTSTLYGAAGRREMLRLSAGEGAP